MQELAAAGAKAAASPREVAAACDVVGVCVQTDAQVRAVVEGENGLLAGAKPGLVIAIHSTVLPSTVEALERARGRAGRRRRRRLRERERPRRDPMFKLFVGGDAAQIEKIRPYLTAIAADRVIHAGALGNGCKAKICLNLITYLQWMAAFESISLARGVGLPLEVLRGRSAARTASSPT